MSSTDSSLFDWLCEHCRTWFWSTYQTSLFLVTVWWLQNYHTFPISRDYGSTEGPQPFVFIISVFLLSNLNLTYQTWTLLWSQDICNRTMWLEIFRTILSTVLNHFWYFVRVLWFKLLMFLKQI